jgi:lipopolysaccharide export system permease protein
MYHAGSMKKTLYAYIFKEIPPPFLVGMGAFTFVLLMGRFLKLAEMVVEKGVPLRDVLWMVIYLLPSFWLYTIPMALLLAVLLAFGRLSADSEITAMKSCGISLYGMLPPALTFSTLACAISLFITAYGVPWGNLSFKTMLVEVAQRSAGIAVKEKVFNNAFPGLVVYADTIDSTGESMRGVIVHDERDPGKASTIFARTGTLISDRLTHSLEFHLKDGSIHRNSKNGDYRLAGFQEYNLRVALASGPAVYKAEADMTLDELLHPPPRSDAKARRSMLIEFHSRLALPFACLVFTLLAMPLGILNRRSGKGAGFSLSIGVILLYYVLISGFQTMAVKRFIPVAVGCWTPNMLFLMLGIYLFRKAAAEEPLPLAARLGRFKKGLMARFTGGERG